MKTAISLFSGCGGDTLGMTRAGLDVIAYTESDPKIRESHEKNFPESRLIGNGDMTRITDEEFGVYHGRVDVIFPVRGSRPQERRSPMILVIRCSTISYEPSVVYARL
jgi:DNA (cytosine-5)-methyltransferase 1